MLERWELPFAEIGAVPDTGELRALYEDEVVGAVPAGFLTDECPRYEWRRRRAGRSRCPAVRLIGRTI